MKKILLLILAMTSLLLSTRCTNDEEENTTLQLSETDIVFTADKGEEDITVVTNREEWSVIGSAEWMEVNRNGSVFTVSVKKNTAVTSRKGKVLVVAGNANATLEVEQKGAKGYAFIESEVLNVNHHEGDYIIDIDANSKEWTVSTDANWFTVESKSFKGELKVSVQENEEREERTGKIFLTVGRINKEIVVKQSGILFYLTPFTKIGAGIKEIKKFEKARGSDLVNQPDGRYNKFFWDFQTESPLFKKVRYGLEEDIYKLAVVYISSKNAFESESEGFKTYLKKNGFEAQNEIIYYNEKLELLATIKLEGETPHILYRYEAKQTQDYPTFTKFPSGYKGWNLDKDNIDLYEKKNGGKFNENVSVDNPTLPYKYLYYDVTPSNNEQPIGRAYFVMKKKTNGVEPGLFETAQYFKSINLAVFKGKDDNYYLTKEFKALCKKEGFKFLGLTANGRYKFINEKKGYGITIIGVQYEEFDFPVIDLHVFPLREEENSQNMLYFPNRTLRKDEL